MRRDYGGVGLLLLFGFVILVWGCERVGWFLGGVGLELRRERFAFDSLNRKEEAWWGCIMICLCRAPCGWPRAVFGVVVCVKLGKVVWRSYKGGVLVFDIRSMRW